MDCWLAWCHHRKLLYLAPLALDIRCLEFLNLIVSLKLSLSLFRLAVLIIGNSQPVMSFAGFKTCSDRLLVKINRLLKIAL